MKTFIFAFILATLISEVYPQWVARTLDGAYMTVMPHYVYWYSRIKHPEAFGEDGYLKKRE